MFQAQALSFFALGLLALALFTLVPCTLPGFVFTFRLSTVLLYELSDYFSRLTLCK